TEVGRRVLAATWNGQVFYKAPTGANGYKSHIHRWNGQYLSCEPIPDQLPQVSQRVYLLARVAAWVLTMSCPTRVILVISPRREPTGVALIIGIRAGVQRTVRIRRRSVVTGSRG